MNSRVIIKFSKIRSIIIHSSLLSLLNCLGSSRHAFATQWGRQMHLFFVFEFCLSTYTYLSSRMWHWNVPSSYSAFFWTTSASRWFSCAIFIWLWKSSLAMITSQAGWSPVCTASLPTPVVISLIRVFKMMLQSHVATVSTKTLKTGLSSTAHPNPFSSARATLESSVFISIFPVCVTQI